MNQPDLTQRYVIAQRAWDRAHPAPKPRGRRRKKKPEQKARLSYNSGYFIWSSAPGEHYLARTAGFTFSTARNYWWTRDWKLAYKLVAYADGSCEAILSPHFEDAKAALMASHATDAAIEIPSPPGLEYMPFQRAGIAYAMERRSTLIADEMGLGKTIQAIGVINSDPEIKAVLVVCPASLKLNWQRELHKWLVRPMFTGIIRDYMPYGIPILILNYDVLHKHAAALANREFDLLIVDEAHYAKNPNARRSQHLYSIRAKRRLFLTGTPIVNRPLEVYPLLVQLAPEEFGNPAQPERAARQFKNKYAAASVDNLQGRLVLNELQTRMRMSIMVRRLKKDVLTELPPKMRQVIELPAGSASSAVAAEQAAINAAAAESISLRVAVELAKASENWGDYSAAVGLLKKQLSVSMGEISRLRHQTALAKVPAIIEHIRESLAGGQPVVLFAHHKDVIAAYYEAFQKAAVTLVGDMTLRARQESVDRFQAGSAQLFIGSIQAAGVGITLTKGSHVIFAELDWVPGNMSQAEDRCHRIGQHDSVLVQHLVLEGSLDATIANRLVEKQKVIDAALDADEREELAADPIVAAIPEHFATAGVTWARIGNEAAKLDVDPETIRLGLRQLADEPKGVNSIDAMLADVLGAKKRLTARESALGKRITERYAEEVSE